MRKTSPLRNKIDQIEAKKGKKKSKSKGKIEEKKKKKVEFDFNKYKISNRYQLLKVLGSGSFGEVHLSYDFHSNKLICLKFEDGNSKSPQLRNEYDVLNCINEDGKVEGFVNAYNFEKTQNNFNYIVMDLLGPNLSDLLGICNGRFSIITTCLIGLQLLDRIEVIHEKGFLHRDIKPENFLIGIEDKSDLIYAIDFGLSKKYKDKTVNSGHHIPYKEGKLLTGTARYCSINSHLGIEQSRRDDIESISYLLVYLIKGKLPWQNNSNDDKELEKLTTKKLKISAEQLCEGLPKQFSVFYFYSRTLKFEERPDYNYLRKQLSEILYSIVDYNRLEILIPEEIYNSKKNKVSYTEFMELVNSDLINITFMNEIYLTTNNNIIFTEKNFQFLYDWQINYKDKETLAIKYNDGDNDNKIEEVSDNSGSIENLKDFDFSRD